jgi:alkylation response protein AidB-like acyl-CoA dehydrogenase
MTDTIVDVDRFREQARAWIEANLEPRPSGGREVRRERALDDISAARALQRRLFDGGYAGLSFPAEYGGRGLTAAHERAFREEAADFVTPDLGVAGGVTFGPIARSLLAHASPAFLQRHIPKILSARRSGASSTPSPRPARTSRGSGPERCVTATTGS